MFADNIGKDYICGLLTSFDTFACCNTRIHDDLCIGNGVIPKPSITPCLVEKGVEIIYGEYEIAPYMHGMPTFTIPYSKIAKYLTPEARRLAGLGDDWRVRSLAK